MTRADVTVGPPADLPSRTATPPPRRPVRWYVADLSAYLIFVLGGLLVTARLWLDPGRRVSSANPAGQTLADWLLAHAARFLTHGGNPLFSTRLNVPDGVNLMANPAILGLTLPMAPVTLLAGPDVAYALLLTLAFAATAGCWYWVLSRTVLPNRLAAFLAAALCGFAPGLVAHANGQPGLVAQFLLPLLVYHAAALGRPGGKRGALLGLLIVWQCFISEELLLEAALAGAVLVGVLALWRRETARRLIRPVGYGLLVAAVVSGVLLAYPLWFQFFGPQSYHGLPYDPGGYATDPATYFTFARESLAGSSSIAPRFVRSATEENGFFGFPLLLLSAVFAGWLWRGYLLVRAAVVTSVVVAVLAAGARPRVHGIGVGVPGPYAVLRHLPLVGLTTPTRYSLLLVPLVAVVFGLAIQRAGQLTPARDAPAERHSWLLLWTATCLAALLPIAPTPLTARDRGPVPAFFSSGLWRTYVPAGRTVVAAPLASASTPDPMWWSAVTLLGAAAPRGYFLGPAGPHDRQASLSPAPRPTSLLLQEVWRTRTAAPVDARDRTAASADLAFWRAAVVVVAPGVAEEALWQTVTRLLGRQPIFTGGLWLWTVPA